MKSIKKTIAKIGNYSLNDEIWHNQKHIIMSSFNIDFPGTPQTFVINAGSTIKSKGGIFTGDESTGSFSIKTLIGKIEGNYQVIEPNSNPTKIAITITKKPFIVSTNKIQEEIKSFF